MKNVLITGASGLLGKSLFYRGLSLGMNIKGIIREQTKREGKKDAKLIGLDFSSNWSENKLPQNLDAIIHLAQSSNYREFPQQAMDVFRVNTESTARLLDYAKRIGIKKFIYASSGGVYGNGNEAFKENMSTSPFDKFGYYLGSKACSEILVRSYDSVFQVNVIRPFFIYGPQQGPNFLIPSLFSSVIKGKPIRLQGLEGIRINPIHVEDASAAVLACLEKNESGTFNIAGPDILSIKKIAEIIGDHVGKKPIFEFVKGEPNDLIGDISKMCDELCEPKKKFVESLADCFSSSQDIASTHKERSL